MVLIVRIDYVLSLSHSPSYSLRLLSRIQHSLPLSFLHPPRDDKHYSSRTCVTTKLQAVLASSGRSFRLSDPEPAVKKTGIETGRDSQAENLSKSSTE